MKEWGPSPHRGTAADLRYAVGETVGSPYFYLENIYIHMKQDIITVSILFFIIIGVALWFSASPSYVPYSSTVFSNQAKFEAFSTRNSVGYSSADDNSALEGPVTNYFITPQIGPKAVSGFEGAGVFKSPDAAFSEKLDIFSQANGSLTTEGYGYNNSRGSLVMDQNMKHMLQTRGGNINTPAVIGGSAV